MNSVMQRCGKCGFEFFVAKRVAKPRTEEIESGLKISVSCDRYRAKHCPRCGKEL